MEGLLEKEKCKSSTMNVDLKSVDEDCNYVLVGVIVHSGQANGGHYYSYIRQRDSLGHFVNRRWLKFDDTDVHLILILYFS